MEATKIRNLVEIMRQLETELENLDADGNPQPCECCREEMDTLRAQRDESEGQLHRLAKAAEVPDEGPTEIVGETIAKLAHLQREIDGWHSTCAGLTREKYQAEAERDRLGGLITGCHRILGSRDGDSLSESANRVMKELADVTLNRDRAAADSFAADERIEALELDLYEKKKTISEQAAKIENQRGQIARLHGTTIGDLVDRVERLEKLMGEGVKP